MYGPTITRLPDGYVPYQQWPEFDLVHTPLPSFHPEVVGDGPHGVRWGIWPLTFEEYVSNDEPDLALSDPRGVARFRTILWRRITRTDLPPAWNRFSKKISRIEGFADLNDGSYLERWDESARRYRKRWFAHYADKTHRIEKVRFKEFAAAYEKSSILKVVKRDLLNSLKRKLDADTQGNIILRAVKDVESGELVAGMATLTSKKYGGSFYMSGFICDKASKAPVMIALMDEWFSDSYTNGIRFLHFGEFWMPGKPRSWRGFSVFKAKFGLYYIEYPPVLMRIVRGKFF